MKYSLVPWPEHMKQIWKKNMLSPCGCVWAQAPQLVHSRSPTQYEYSERHWYLHMPKKYQLIHVRHVERKMLQLHPPTAGWYQVSGITHAILEAIEKYVNILNLLKLRVQGKHNFRKLEWNRPLGPCHFLCLRLLGFGSSTINEAFQLRSDLRNCGDDTHISSREAPSSQVNMNIKVRYEPARLAVKISYSAVTFGRIVWLVVRVIGCT